MEVVSVKVDKETRERMRRLSRVNWSETIRRAIEQAIEFEEFRERHVDPKDIEQGLAMASAVRRTAGGWDSTREIREWRDRRK